MKKILAAVALTATLFAGQAQAGDGEAIVGGIIGGLIIGGMLNQHNHAPRHYDPYYEDHVGYQQRCYTRYYREYNYAYEMYEKVPRTVCRWVRVY